MKMKWAGYDQNQESKFAQQQVEWANNILSQENVLYPSGKNSHDCAYEVLEVYEDKLLDLALFRVS